VKNAPLASGSNICAIFFEISSEAEFRSFEQKVFTARNLPVDRLNPNFLHFITPPDVDVMPFLAKSPFFGHVIQREFSNIEEHARQYAQVVYTTVEKTTPRWNPS
jgi:hypothetical protein